MFTLCVQKFKWGDAYPSMADRGTSCGHTSQLSTKHDPLTILNAPRKIGTYAADNQLFMASTSSTVNTHKR